MYSQLFLSAGVCGKSGYVSTAILSEPIVAGGYTWKGFSAVSGGNPMTVLYTGEAGGPQFQATLWSNGDSTISAADADVLAILESVKPAA